MAYIRCRNARLAEAAAAGPTGDEIHVWPISLDPPDGDLVRAREVLAGPDRDRAARFHFARDARRFVAGRSAVRLILGAYLRRPAGALSFVAGPHGKPALADDALQFNFSRSGDWAVLALGRRPIGIDLEAIRPEAADPDVAERFFAAQEVARLRATPEPGRAAAFLRCWTRKEAYLKAVGAGLSLALDSFTVTFDEGESPRLLSSATRPADPQTLTISDLSVGLPGHICAIVHRSEVRSLTIFTAESTEGEMWPAASGAGSADRSA